MTRSLPPSALCTSGSCPNFVLRLVTALLLASAIQLCSGSYYGKLISKLSELHHGVSGKVYAVDGRTLYIKDFKYDGEGPAAYFYAGTSKAPNGNGFRIRDERGTTNPLKRYKGKDITLTLPEGKTLSNIKWFSVWCDDFSVNFGDVKIPRGFDYPRPLKLAALNGVHGVSSEPIVIVDAQTLLIPGFSYDGEAPDAKFWVGAGPSPSPQGTRVPDENGKETPLRRYDHKTIVLTLPDDLTVHQLGHFGVWCEAFTVDFGHVQIPQGLNVPPSLKMLHVSPQSKLNCEVLQDDLAFEVRWAVAGDSIVFQLVAKLDAGEYMSFGLSAEPEKSAMVGGDVVVAWVDKKTLQGYAVDYFLDAKSQCSGGRGSCPDLRIQDHTSSIRLLNAAMVNGYSIVTYQRPLKASDELDQPIRTNGSQAIIWAIGPLNQRNEVSFHSSYLKKDLLIEFGRPPMWNCPMPDQEKDEDDEEKLVNNKELAATTRRPQRLPATPAPAQKIDVWEIPAIQCYEPEDGVFYAQMGPTGGKHGYPAITGHVGWGISWYINGLLIPEINVVRGKKYTFVVEGGLDPETPARYHPFYITDDPIGGYQHKTEEEKATVNIFAGVRRQRGSVQPTGVGRLCNWVPDQNQPIADDFASFGAYQRTLTLECDHGEPGIVEWTPDKNTPDTVYYQCFTHRYLGWKINVHDSCDAAQSAASETHEVFTEPESDEDLHGGASIRVSSKVTPAPEFFQQHREYARHPSFIANPFPGKLSSHSLLTHSNNQNYDAYERFQSFENHASKPTYSPATLDSHKHMHTLTHNRPKLAQGYQTQGASPRRPAAAISYAVTERDQDSHPSNSQSQLIADSRPILSYGMKFSYAQGPPKHSRPMHQKTQMLVLRRPVQNRRPMSPAPRPMALGNPVSLPRPVYFVDKKKPIFRGTPLHLVPNRQVTKLTKALSKAQSTIEAKMSQADILQSRLAPSPAQHGLQNLEPARNTGFRPESVVIEGGFKPIIKSIDIAEERSSYAQEDDRLPDIVEYQPLDSFEPMFIPSPPDRNQNKKLKKKAQAPWVKPRLDDLDDMEMAADRLDAYYLPPANPKSKPQSASLPAGALVTYDGKQVLDSNLAQSIPRVSEPPQSRLSSDVLSRTPQFGEFTGELPPPIPGNVRAENIPQLNARNSQRQLRIPDELAAPVYSQPQKIANTRLTLVERAKRSAHHIPGHEGDDMEEDDVRQIINSMNNASIQDHHDHNHTGHDHDHDHDHKHNSTEHDADNLKADSAGQLVFANFEYILLTAILYFII